MTTPDDIRQARTAAGLTTAQAAALCFVSQRAWQYWESGGRPMPMSAWTLFNLRKPKSKATQQEQ